VIEKEPKRKEEKGKEEKTKEKGKRREERGGLQEEYQLMQPPVNIYLQDRCKLFRSKNSIKILYTAISKKVLRLQDKRV
jgi:hypothetical protein